MRSAARRVRKKKTPEIIKRELLASILEVFEGKDYLKDGKCSVKKYEGLLKEANRKIIHIIGKQEELLKKFKDSNEYFVGVGLNRSNIYFKISLYKFLCKFPLLKNSTLTSSYFNGNFKSIKNVCKTKAEVFGEKK